jgi:hypothetical protein
MTFTPRIAVASDPRSATGNAAPFSATPGSELIDGNRMDSRVWFLDGYLTTPNLQIGERSINFDSEVPEALCFSYRDRETLITVEKELLKWLRQIKLCSWEYMAGATRCHFRMLMRFMSERDYARLGDITPQAAHDFIEYPKKTGVRYAGSRGLFLRRLHELWLDGLLPDGLRFYLHDHESESLERAGCDGGAADGSEAVYDEDEDDEDQSEFMDPRNETEPFDEDTFLRMLGASLKFIRAIKNDLIQALHELEMTGNCDIERFRDFPYLRGIKRLGLNRLLREFQRACYIIIASSLIGRSNEYLGIGRVSKCYKPEMVDGEESHVILIPWSKRRDKERPLARGRGTELTVEAIRALDEIVSAHPATRNSPYLFCRFRKTYRTGPTGGPVSRNNINAGLRVFLKGIAGFSSDEIREVHPHRFRSTAIVNLCCVENGVIAAWIEARHESIDELCNYALAAKGWMGIEDNLNAMAA